MMIKIPAFGPQTIYQPIRKFFNQSSLFAQFSIIDDFFDNLQKLM